MADRKQKLGMVIFDGEKVLAPEVGAWPSLSIGFW
jgi:hypothetical protein